MLNRSHAAFDELRQGVKDIEFLADPTAGEVRIGGTTPLLASFVSAVIDRLHRRYPRMVFSVTMTNADALLRDLDQRNLDLLLLRKFGSFDEHRLISKRFTTIPISWRLEQTTPGVADGASSLPSSLTNVGCFRRQVRGSDRLSGISLVPRDCPAPAPPWSHTASR